MQELVLISLVQLPALNLFVYLSNSHTFDLKHKYSSEMLNGLEVRSGIPAYLRITVCQWLLNYLCIAMPHLFILLFNPYNPFLQILQNLLCLAF